MSAVLILFKRRPGAGTLRSAGSTPPAKSRGCSLCAHSRPRRIECVLRRAFAVFGCSECRREPFLDRTKVEQKKKNYSHTGRLIRVCRCTVSAARVGHGGGQTKVHVSSLAEACTATADRMPTRTSHGLSCSKKQHRVRRLGSGLTTLHVLMACMIPCGIVRSLGRTKAAGHDEGRVRSRSIGAFRRPNQKWCN